MSIRQQILIAWGSSRAPLSGLTPSWATYVHPGTGSSATGPAIAELGTGTGLYSFSIDDDHCGVIDLGASATPRYVAVVSVNTPTFVLFDSSGVPLAGQSPIWNACVDASDGSSATEPTITELSGGLYRIDDPPATTVGIIDGGSSAVPRYFSVGLPDGVSGVPPTISNYSPAEGSVITAKTPLGFDVTGSVNGLANVALGVRFTGSIVVELAYDGSQFQTLYAGASTVTSISGGLRFSLLRAGGWPSTPTVLVIAVDAAGNVST
jgi:hypothetical protein